MDSPWFIAYLVLVGLAVVQSVVLGMQTWEHRRFARSCMRSIPQYRPTGRAVVFAPCKGIDVDLEGNLRALLQQDYDDYEVTFLVEDIDDPAVEVIRRVTAECPWVPTRLIVAGRAATCGQKVHNLRAGTASVPPEVEYLAFIDSDARPRPDWLRTLLAQLSFRKVNVVTGYRWFAPARDSLANRLLYSMNCQIMALLGHSSHYLVWGGSWGIRREVFEAIGLREAWKGTLSDDLVATRQLLRARERVRFEPGCVVASPLDMSFRTMLAFVRRQYLVARFYIPAWWALGLLVGLFGSVVLLANLAAMGWSLMDETIPAWIPTACIAVLYLTGAFRGWMRQDLVEAYFPERREQLRRAMWFDVLAGPLVKLTHWLGMLGALVGRDIVWRGVTYRVERGGRIGKVLRETPPPIAHENSDTKPHTRRADLQRSC